MTMSAPPVDLADPETFVDGVPYDWFDQLRRNDPVHRHPDPRTGVPFWAITRHEDVVRVSRDAGTFSSEERLAVFREPENEFELTTGRLMMLNMDPPDHTRLRAIVNKGFTPRHIAKMADRVREFTERIVGEALHHDGPVDFVRTIAAELPLDVIAEIIGVPDEDRDWVFDVSNRLVGYDDPSFLDDPGDLLAAAGELLEYAGRIQRDRAESPRDDIATALVQAEVDGQSLDETQYSLFFLLLAVAGNETTRNAISHGMQAFMDHPEQWRRLIEDRSLLSTATDEILRWAHPVIQFRRTAMRDVELGGTTIREGDKVVIYYASANRDEDVFTDPYRFDIGRTPNPQISFGAGGPHYCLGAALARLELETVFDVLADQVPDIRQAGTVRRLRSNFINGLVELPVILR